MKIRVALLAILTLLTAGCVTSNAVRPTKVAHSDQELKQSKIAMNEEFACGLRHVSEIDDGISDARTVALALSALCIKEQTAATEAFAKAHLDNDAQIRIFRNRRNSQAERINDFLPIVFKYRHWKRLHP